MIVPMKKVTVIVQSKDADAAIQSLGSLGVLHVEHQRAPQGKDISQLHDDIELANKALSILSFSEFQREKHPISDKKLDDWKACARHIINLYSRLEQLKEYSITLRNEISNWEHWGDFDPEDIKCLSKKNIYIKLYQIPTKELKKLPKDIAVRKISIIGGMNYCAIISQEEIEVPFKEVKLPKNGLEKMRARLKEDKQTMQSIKGDISRSITYRQAFEDIKKMLIKELEFHEALNGMGQAGQLMYITGYIPHDETKLLVEHAKNEKWGIFITDPSEKDRIPTLIRNPRWVSIIKPIFKLLEIIPGYRELDISMWFLLFFSVFFGMLIGDAGYGFVFFIITFLTHLKIGRTVKNKSIFVLFYILSLCAVIWGILTGTFFGQEWLPQTVKPLIPALRNNKNIQTLCFLLGALQLSVAHLWRSLVKLPRLSALADIGWTIILWGAFFLAKALILGDNFPGFGKWLFVIGMFLVIFFTNPVKNIFKGIGSGLGSLLLNIVNTFTDIVSYIRLFAVGLATVAIADAFNKMALGIGFSSILTSIFTALILLLGHSLNIVLGPLAILVHGVRLNVLEFCGHLDITWSGFSYKPLRKQIDNKEIK